MTAPLPNATLQNPACGCCGSETDHDGEHFICDDCGLLFDADTLSASFFYDDSLPCGNGCANTWHGDNRIKPGQRFGCGTCLLPTGHRSLCWTGCVPVALDGVLV